MVEGRILHYGSRWRSDHHGGHERGLESFKHFKKDVPRSFAIQARGHHNTEKIGQNTKIWLEKHVLDKEHVWPKQASTKLSLNAKGIPQLHVTPDMTEQVESIEIYYALKTAVSFQRAWRDVKVSRKDKTYFATMPILNVDDYIFAFANIKYKSTIVLSTKFNAAIPSKLGKAIATDKPSSTLYSGDGALGNWFQVAPAEGKGGIKGFRAINKHRGTGTEQLSDPKFKAPKGANLAFKFYCTQPQTLTFKAGDHYQMTLEITASNDWQEMIIKADKLINVHNKQPMKDWEKVGKIHFNPQKGSDITKIIFAEFKWVK